MSKRTEQLGTEIMRKFSHALAEVFPLEQSGVCTVRTVEVLPDLSEVRIYISRIGGEEDFFTRLNSAKNLLKKRVFANIPLRKIPDIFFYEDFTGEHTERMEKMLRD